MSTAALFACTILYLVSSVDLYLQGKEALALTFFAYAIANVGLIAEAMK